MTLVASFLEDIPDGVEFTPQKPEMFGMTRPKDIKIPAFKQNKKDVIKIGDFTININMIEKHALLKMRLLLPSAPYLRLKNSKNARLQR